MRACEDTTTIWSLAEYQAEFRVKAKSKGKKKQVKTNPPKLFFNSSFIVQRFIRKNSRCSIRCWQLEFAVSISCCCHKLLQGSKDTYIRDVKGRISRQGKGAGRRLCGLWVSVSVYRSRCLNKARLAASGTLYKISAAVQLCKQAIIDEVMIESALQIYSDFLNIFKL